jgi:hypothetical protein
MAKRTWKTSRPRNAIVNIYSECKYFAEQEVFDNEITVNYSGIESFEIVSDEDAEEIEAAADASGIDDFHEYLLLYLPGGKTATFRNSYCDLLFI